MMTRVERIERQSDLLYDAWGLIANAGGVAPLNWHQQPPPEYGGVPLTEQAIEWVAAAERWRGKWNELRDPVLMLDAGDQAATP